MKIGNVFLSIVTLVGVLAGGAASAQSQMIQVNGQLRPAYREGEVIVKYKDGANRSFRTMTAMYSRVNVVAVDRFKGAFKNFEKLTFNTSNLSVEQVVADIQRDPSVEYVQPNYMLYAFPNQLAQPKKLGEPCMIPGIPYPPGCEDSGGGGGGTPPPGGGQPCLIPGIPYPPGCEDGGGGGGGGGPTPPPANRPAIPALPAEVNPPVADPNLSQAWGVLKVSADKAWSIEKGSKNLIVAVIDTGVDYTHPDLAFNIWRNPKALNAVKTGVDAQGDEITGDVVGWDFVHNDNLPYDDNEHGTHCAGTIGAVGGDGQGVSGVNQRVSIMAVKFLSGQGSGTTADAIKGIDYAVSRGAKVLSNSWGGKGDDGNNALKDAILRAQAKGVLFIAAAGNDSTNNDSDPVYPAAFNLENMITVAATSETDGLAYFSNTGAKSVHVGAPGTNVYSTVPGNKYNKLSGTSMACPHVAGAAALVWSHFPNADFKEIKRRLMDSGDAVGALSGKTITGKRINVLNALN
ncbi:MAG: S8 family peptidase [Bacteriovoracia bacterium]